MSITRGSTSNIILYLSWYVAEFQTPGRFHFVLYEFSSWIAPVDADIFDI